MAFQILILMKIFNSPKTNQIDIMRKVLLFFAAMAMIRSHAQNPLLVENFDDAAGVLLTTMGWTAHSGATTNPIAIVSPGLSWTQTAYPGSGVGNAAGVVNTGQDLNKPLSSNVTSGAVYTSFLVKAGAPVTSSQYFFHYVEYGNITTPVYTTLNNNYRARTYISPGTDPNTQFKLGLMWGSGSLTGDTTANLTVGSTYLVVVKYEFIAGANNDEVSLWVFEDGDNIASLPANPTIGPLTGTLDYTAIQGIALRQGGSGQNAIVDGIITDTVFGFAPPTCTPARVEILTDSYGSEITWTIVETSTGVVHASGGPYPDFASGTYNAANALYVDTVCLPDNGTYEFRIEDSFGDGLTDGVNMGWYQVDILCPWGSNRVATIDTTLVSQWTPSHYGPFHYGSTTNAPMYDSTVFGISCIQYSDVTLQVDMNQVSQSFVNATVGSNLNSWWPWAAMTDSNGDNIWEATLSLPVGYSLEYKFGTEDPNVLQEQLDPNAPCTNGNTQYTNRVLVVPSADTILPVVCWSSCDSCSAVSIDEALGNISLFPNPTSGAFTMERSELAGNIEVTVIGLQGQLLFATKWAAGQSELNIDLSDLAAGVYMVRLTAEEGTRTLRVAVQR